MAQDATTCSIFGQSVWNLHDQKILERSAHWRHKINWTPLLYETWFTTPPTFGTFSLCNFRFKLISDNKQCTESCKFSCSLGVYPIHMRNGEILNVFLFSFWTLLSLIWDILHPCWCDLQHTPEITFQMVYHMGLPVHHCQFRKTWHLPWAGKS